MYQIRVPNGCALRACERCGNPVLTAPPLNVRNRIEMLITTEVRGTVRAPVRRPSV